MALLTLALAASSGLLIQPAVRHRSYVAPHHRVAGGSSPLLMCDAFVETELPEARWVEIAQTDSEPDAGATTMPLFPLGASYLPYTEPVLNIFEPRYRSMYNDLLFNGARRFAVVNIDPETGGRAEVGVVFYLDDLKEVSEQTQDRVKYVGSHRVIGRIKLDRVLNPSVMSTRQTYLKAQVEDFEDVDEEEISEEEHTKNEELFMELVKAQTDIDEEPRFTKAVREALDFKKGSSAEDKGLWGVILLWQQFLEQRTVVLGQKMQRDIQKGVQDYLKENKLREELISPKGEIRLEDLPAPLLQEIRAIQTRYREELDARDSNPAGSQFQALLQSNSHRERLAIFQSVLAKERKRLQARSLLQSLFKGDSS